MAAAPGALFRGFHVQYRIQQTDALSGPTVDRNALKPLIANIIQQLGNHNVPVNQHIRIFVNHNNIDWNLDVEVLRTDGQPPTIVVYKSI